MTMSRDEQKFVDAAYEEAQFGLAEGGIPIGSVLVKDRESIVAVNAVTDRG